ncbi:Serine/threonine-protein kinase LMTK3 [Fukomys damarensis]|uniref:Serine/threonine-protein kinase LMTK3 n=1 Tax=Fukomys damarensis TaxID=885580 RepID=A0A091D5E0_FUKDA|nr:Serine/threonine-protein kinase LMTK3 [Fukomys damarensis]
MRTPARAGHSLPLAWPRILSAGVKAPGLRPIQPAKVALSRGCPGGGEDTRRDSVDPSGTDRLGRAEAEGDTAPGSSIPEPPTLRERKPEDLNSSLRPEETLRPDQEFENPEGEDCSGEYTPPAEETSSSQSLPDVYILPLAEVSLPMPAPQPSHSDMTTPLGLSRQHLSYLQEIGSGWFGKVILGEIFSDYTPAQVVVKELRASAGPLEQRKFISEAQPYRYGGLCLRASGSPSSRSAPSQRRHWYDILQSCWRPPAQRPSASDLQLQLTYLLSERPPRPPPPPPPPRDGPGIAGSCPFASENIDSARASGTCSPRDTARRDRPRGELIPQRPDPPAPPEEGLRVESSVDDGATATTASGEAPEGICSLIWQTEQPTSTPRTPSGTRQLVELHSAGSSSLKAFDMGPVIASHGHAAPSAHPGGSA